MRKTVVAFLALFLLSVCSKKETNFQQELTSDTSVSSDNRTIVKDFPMINQKPISSDLLSKIFPESFGNLKLDKVNKGKINYSTFAINTASGEYVSSLGLVVIYIYDYVSFSNLPEHLQNLYNLKPGKDVHLFKNGIGMFSSDEISNANRLDLIYYGRFYIKIEAVNYPNFRETAMDLLHNLNLAFLDNLIKEIDNE